jgi:dTMP kinase
LRDAYRHVAADEPKRCVLVDANADAGAVAASVWAAVRDRLFAADAVNLASSA